MYTFIIKEEGPDLDVIVTRSMLALAAIAALFFRTGAYFIINLFSAAILCFAAIFIKLILVKLNGNKIALLAVSACILFFATQSITFAALLLVYGYLAKYLNRQPIIQIEENGVTIMKLFSKTICSWAEFSNIVLKDNLLTLDFKNNKLIQVSMVEDQTPVDEHEFNEFCKRFINRIEG